jgi:hypothetical protein
MAMEISRRKALLLASAVGAWGSAPTPAQLVQAIRAKAKALEGGAGMKSAYDSFLTQFHLQADAPSYSDFVVTRLFYEATRDAGFWNLHWAITNMPPNSDEIWKQWKKCTAPSPAAPTATAECDELSALFAFLAGRAGVHGVGLFWPAANHTIAAWVVKQAAGQVRVVIPTTQIFLDENDYWGTKKFDPWRQKAIYEYTRRDVADSFELPGGLYDFFLRQTDKYAGASDSTLQLLRYLREGVFRNTLSGEAAAREALRVGRNRGRAAAEDLAAFQSFARDMQGSPEQYR